MRWGLWVWMFWLLVVGSLAQEKIIIDTDIGDDVDDAFALALAVKSPELQVLGISTAFGETELRATSAPRKSTRWS